jgi:hypothetical protein
MVLKLRVFVGLSGMEVRYVCGLLKRMFDEVLHTHAPNDNTVVRFSLK